MNFIVCSWDIHPGQQKKLHDVYLKAQSLIHQDIVRIARVSSDSVMRYLKAYVEGGVTALCSSNFYCPRSALWPHDKPCEFLHTPL